MADEHIDDESDAAARAFAQLLAETTILRRAVEGLPAIVRSIEAPDYGPSFGALAKAVNATEARLATIEGHPALKQTPAALGEAMERAVAQAVAPAADALRTSAHDIGAERRALADLVGRAQGEQKRRQLWFAGAGVAAGFLLFPLLGIIAPGGSVLAALATGNLHRWPAGVQLIEEGDPERSEDIFKALRLREANAEALKTCEEVAKKTGKEQKCAINVAAPGP